MKKIKKTTEARQQVYYAVLSDVSNEIYRNCSDYIKEFKTKIPADCLQELVESIEIGKPINFNDWVDMIQTRRASKSCDNKKEANKLEVIFKLPEDEAHCFLCACEQIIEHLTNVHNAIAEAIGCTEED